MTAKIAEIFKSVQGEGIYAGEEQLFIRFFGCNLFCSFCDTLLKDSKEYTCEELKEEVLKYNSYHSISLTGGEPLLQTYFLKTFLPQMRGLGKKIYLETNGTLPHELIKILDFVDIIAMDFKLPSSCGCGSFWKQHEDFLKLSSDKEVFVKMVISKNTEEKDIWTSAEIIRKIRPATIVILQLNWFDMGGVFLEKMGIFKKHFLKAGITDTRILPQAHKYAGIK